MLIQQDKILPLRIQFSKSEFFDVLTCVGAAAMLGATKRSPRSHAGALVPMAHMRASGLRELTEGKMEKGGPGGATSGTGESFPQEELRQEAAMLSRGVVRGRSPVVRSGASRVATALQGGASEGVQWQRRGRRGVSCVTRALECPGFGGLVYFWLVGNLCRCLVEKVRELTCVLGDSLVPMAARRTSEAVIAEAFLRGYDSRH